MTTLTDIPYHVNSKTIGENATISARAGIALVVSGYFVCFGLDWEGEEFMQQFALAHTYAQCTTVNNHFNMTALLSSLINEHIQPPPKTIQIQKDHLNNKLTKDNCSL